VDNLDVRKVVEMVSRQAKINIFVSPGVSGMVTLNLQDKTVDETLQTIAKLCRLTVQREQGVIYISTPAEVRQGEEDSLPVRVYHLNYVRSSDVEKMVKPLLSKKGMMTSSPDSEVGLATDAAQGGDKAKEVKGGGNAMAVGDIVVVQDYEQVLKTVDRVIAQIDTQPIQVLIEAVIVSVKLEKGMELGVNFALLDGAGKVLGLTGNGAAINSAAGFSPASVLAAGNTGLLKGTPTSGFAEDAAGLKFGFVDKSTTGFIRALETMGETKVLACPRILVLNKQRAEIHLGDRLGYTTTTQTQTSTVQTVQFVDVGTQLRLRPFVSSDGMVRLEVHPERSSGTVTDPATPGVPQVTAAQVTTNIMVPDGATIVIGGLIDNEVDHKWAGVPLLSRLPWIGSLFRDTTNATTKKELIVILTPHIWRPECPEAGNYLGRPRSLGLDRRVSQRPYPESKDPPSLYELPRLEFCPESTPTEK
jgi:type IV pilus secretin PilQ/predicted competence protein